MRVRTGGALTIAVLSVVYWAAHTMLRPLVGPFVLDLGGTAAQASTALAAFAVLPTVLAIPIGFLVDRLGHRRLLVWGSLAMIAGGGLLLLGTIPAVIAGQLVVGLGTLAVWVALQAAATLPTGAAETRDERNRRIASFSLFVSAGQLVGPALGGAVAELAGFRTSVGVFVGLSVLLVVVTHLGVRRATAVPAAAAGAASVALLPGLGRSYLDALRLLRSRAVLITVAASFLALVVLDLRTAFQPLHLQSIGFSPLWTGLLLTTAATASFISRPAFGPLVRWLPAPLLVGLVLGVGSVSVAAVVLTDGVVALLLLAAVNGFALGFAQPLTLALMADHTDAAQRGLAVGIRSMANRGAQLADPVAFGLLLAAFGTRTAFLAMGAALLVLSVVTGLAFVWVRPPPDVVDVAPAQPVAAHR